MARTKQTWGDARAEIYALLRENEDESPYWTPTLLLQLLNECRDELDMHLAETFESYNILSVTTSIVADQSHYSVPNDCNRLLHVSRLFPDSGYEVPLERLDRWTEPTVSPGGSGATSGDYLPTYTLEDRWVRLDPVPGAAITDGLKLHYERGLSKIDSDDDEVLLPAWPFICESLLKYMVACSAYEVEGAIGSNQPGYYQSLLKKRDDLMEKLEMYAETRSFGKVYSTRYRQGD